MTNIDKLMEKLSSNSLAVYFCGDPKREENLDNFSNFYNYTNVKEEGSIFLIDADTKIAYLFIPENTEFYNKWIGKRISKETASELSGIKLENILYCDSFETYFNSLLANKVDNPYVYLDIQSSSKITRNFIEKQQKNHPEIIFRNTYAIDSYIRSIKTDKQIEDMKIAIQITNEGIKELMLNTLSVNKECQLESYFDKVIKFHNCSYSFETIAASGKNATCLHYSENDSEYKNDDMILFDLGAKYNDICADISRTFPISGKFSTRQAAVYQEVLNCNKEIISSIKPGISLKELHQKSVDLLANSCIKLGLISEKKEVSKYYFHSIGHHLGLVCHDLGTRSDALEANMVVTVEPGLYIPEWNIGIRIEDDVLVTKESCINLSSDIIKEIADIEEFMS